MLEELKIEVFYTGGGIWLAEAYLDQRSYIVVNSEAPEYITIYKYHKDDEKYLPDDMIASKHKDELVFGQRELYEKLLNKLEEKML